MTDLRLSDATQHDRIFVSEELEDLANRQGMPDCDQLSKHFQIACEETGHIAAEATIDCRWGLAKVDNLIVHEDHRRKGNGRELLRLVEEFCRANDISHIKATTKTWECSALYEHCGFREEARIPFKATINGVQQFEITYAKALN